MSSVNNELYMLNFVSDPGYASTEVIRKRPSEESDYSSFKLDNNFLITYKL